MELHESTPNAPDPSGGERRRRWAAMLTVLEVTLWLLALTCLGWVGWMWVDARQFQLNATIVENEAVVGTVGGDGTAAEQRRLPPPAVGTAIARLRVPRLDLSVVVAEGTSPRVLQRAVGHLAASAPPGGEGNVALAGHRDTFFRPLEAIRPGDQIVLTTPRGSDVYKVDWTKTVEPSAVSVLQDPGYPVLTLITCYPFRFVGSAPQRFIVRARLVRRLAPEEGDAPLSPPLVQPAES